MGFPELWSILVELHTFFAAFGILHSSCTECGGFVLRRIQGFCDLSKHDEGWEEGRDAALLLHGGFQACQVHGDGMFQLGWDLLNYYY